MGFTTFKSMTYRFVGWAHCPTKFKKGFESNHLWDKKKSKFIRYLICPI